MPQYDALALSFYFLKKQSRQTENHQTRPFLMQKSKGFTSNQSAKRLAGGRPLAGIGHSCSNRLMSRLLAALVTTLSLAGCYVGDPGVHVAYQRDFRGRVDHACIGAALRTVAPNVRRGTYQANGNGPRGFARGTIVTQFGYEDPSGSGYYSLDVATQPDGLIHYWHGWGKVGTKVSEEEQRSILPLLMRANRAVEQRCDLSFAGTTPIVGDG